MINENKVDESKNPWTILETRQVYDNPWISVREDKVISPGGQEGIYGVTSFKNRAIAIVPVDEEGFTFLVGQYRYPLEEYSWEIPMGGGPLEDDDLDSAKRELREETGLDAENWEVIMRLHTSNSVTDEEGYTYLATGLTHGEWEPEHTEDLTLIRVPFEEAIEMVMDNRITDAISIAGLLKAEKILRQRKMI